MRVLILTRDTLSQRYLIRRISEEFELIGIFFQREPSPMRNFLRRLKAFRNPLSILWQTFWYFMIRDSRVEKRRIERELFTENGEVYTLPKGVPVMTVEKINGQITCDFIREHRPDCIAVSGTQLLRKPVLSLYPEFCPKGIVNMHTGLSPYVRGGGATFWALYSGHPEYVGVTIHFIDPGIDSGNIILSGRPQLKPDDRDITLDAKVRRVGIYLYIKALRQIEEGSNKNVKQWEEGQLFARKTGYVQTPWFIYKLRKKFRKERVIENYLVNRDKYDKGIVVVE